MRCRSSAPSARAPPRRGLEQLLLALEVVVERPEADVGRLGDLLDARPFPPPFGDQPDRGVDRVPAWSGPSDDPAGWPGSPFCSRTELTSLSSARRSISTDLMLQTAVPPAELEADAAGPPGFPITTEGSTAQAATFVLRRRRPASAAVRRSGAARCPVRTSSYPRPG